MTSDHGLPAMAPAQPGRDATGRTPRPPYDATVGLVNEIWPVDLLTPEKIVPNRDHRLMSSEAIAAMFDLDVTWLGCPGYGGAEIPCAVIRRPGDDEVGPGFLWIHGGGMVGGTADSAMLDTASYLAEHGGTVVSVGYRLAPEHPAPTPVEDCYAALRWAVEHAAELRFDPDRLIVGGGSAGGGLAAGVMLLVRDRGGPAITGVMLQCPMLDDTSSSVSVQQFDVSPGWCGQSNHVAWQAYLGEAFGTDGISPYDAPARAPWLGNLPPVHIAVGSADPFRDEDVAFAVAIWRDGGDCELYVAPGGNHGYELVAPSASIAQLTAASRQAWVRRRLVGDDMVAAREGVARMAEAFAEHADDIS